MKGRSDEGLSLLTSALETLFGEKFGLSTQLIKSNSLVLFPPPFPTDVSPQFLYELTLLIAVTDGCIPSYQLECKILAETVANNGSIPFDKACCIFVSEMIKHGLHTARI